jgi:hypothetical protein
MAARPAMAAEIEKFLLAMGSFLTEDDRLGDRRYHNDLGGNPRS